MEKLVQALHDKVILKKVEFNEQVVGGIIIPDTGKEKSNYFEVVDHGDGMYNPHMGNYYPMKVSVGDMVIVPKAVVTQIIVEGEEYYVCREVEILAIVKQ
jgi:chaperonin GroES